MSDISGFTNEYVDTIYNSHTSKKWIKRIDKEKTISYDNYNRNTNFMLVANIVLDNELYEEGKNKGKKKRKTLIQFLPCIDTDKFDTKNEWLYIFTINNQIVKLGGTRTGLKGRISSYLCGHHTEERGKSGDCSKTNAYIYNTFEFYLRLGCCIQMYGYELPKYEVKIKIFEEEEVVIPQIYHKYESKFLYDYKKNYLSFPILSYNCEPENE